ncbi:MAG TPA: Uma2 family endonuclease [Polyangiaceae bacterium]|nr:Uma2 family endonuclease [Polyangiaceae bacterium]
MSSEQAALHFPMSAKVPESSRHFRLRMVLYQFLKRAFEDVAMIGSDQFLYWEPKNPRACLAPDAFVCFGNKNADFDSWKVWERGVPQVAVEIVSDSDASEASWEVKLDRYRRVGVSELVWFDYHAKERPLRIWDFVGDDLLERRLSEPYAQSQHLGGYWLPVETDNGDLSLRLSRDEQGLQLFPTAEEYYAEQRWVEAEKRRAAEAALGRESEARQRESEALQSRIAELEAELRRRS